MLSLLFMVSSLHNRCLQRRLLNFSHIGIKLHIYATEHFPGPIEATRTEKSLRQIFHVNDLNKRTRLDGTELVLGS